jgi:photosystem II stability/assembly factor-like uncharacterized protein
MKKKIFNILGVAVTVAMVLALGAAFSAAPAAANPAEKLNEWYTFAYPDAGSEGDWFRQGTDAEEIDRVGEITEAINGDLYVYAELGRMPTHEILKSEDGGRSWEITKYSDPDDGVVGGRVFDMVCSSIDEDIVYATDGCYVYKTEDGGDTWDYVGKDSLETALVGACGCNVCGDGNWRVITSLDVTYDDDDNPFVFIGTWAHGGDLLPAETSCYYSDTIPGDVLYIGEAGYPANWTSLNLSCYGAGYNVISVGCAPDWADSKETYVVVTKGTDASGDTHVIYTKGTVCGWTEFAELKWNCLNSFGSWAASRIAFPDDWADTETLFVGITDASECSGGDGGDVYMATDGDAIDMNVAGIETGCVGEEPVDIISLDVMGDTDDAALIAGEYCNTNVWYSTDGGWSWDASEKNPTGVYLTYVIFYEDTALAVTTGCDCAVSMSCGEEVGQYWNQISLIATGIDEVLYIDHSPGYVCGDSETMFMLSRSTSDPCWPPPTQSLFRYDGTYWERVNSSNLAEDASEATDNEVFQRVRVSPDFNTTNTVFLTNRWFEMWRSQDAGCSWDMLTFPCHPRGFIGAVAVIDEDTLIAGGAASTSPSDTTNVGTIFKTVRHGARPWKEYDIDTTANIVSLALEPGYEDPGSVLAGTNASEVFISEDGGETWDLVGDFYTDVTSPSTYATWVVFDPDYATNHIIYAAAGDCVARCVIDPEEDWADQEWEVLCCDEGETFWGIAATGDTVLYVADDDTAQLETADTDQEICYEGGVLRSLNPGVDEEGAVIDAEDVVFERIGPGLDDGETQLRYLWLTCDTSDDGCAETIVWSIDWSSYRENIWVYEDTLAQPVVLAMPVDEQKLTKTDEATLSWEELCGADCYEVSLYAYCAECPDNKLTVDLSELAAMDCCPVATVVCGPELECNADVCTEDTCIVVDDLDPGTTYYWQVRVCQGKPTLSKWSEERSFTTALSVVEFEELCSPACGSQDIILTPNFAWGAVDGATGYEVGLSTTDTFTAVVAGGATEVNAWVCPTTLDYATTYYWRVRAVKDTIYSDWTYCMFTTMPEPVAPTPPVVIQQVPPSAPPVINIPPAEMITPSWIYAIIGVGAALAIVVIVLIVRTRRPPA